MLGCQGQNCRLSWLEILAICLIVEGNYRTELFIDELVIARLRFTGFYSLDYPLLELELLGIGTTVYSKFIIVFAPPEFFRSKPESFPIFGSQMRLVLIVISWDIWSKGSSVSVLIE